MTCDALVEPTKTPELERHRRTLWGLCYGMTGSAADAEDLVQETFVRALERPPVDRERAIGPWLVTVAANLARDALRRRKRAAYVGPWLPSPVDDELAPAVEIEGDAGAEDRYAIVERVGFAFLVALEVLTPNQRAVVVLRDVLELSVEEAARALDLSTSNVKTLHLRARRALAAQAAEARRRAKPDVAAAVVQRFAAGLALGDVDAALAPDATSTNDGGGQYHAALNVVRGAERVARLHLGLQRRRLGAGTDGLRVAQRTVGGLPALVALLPPNGPHEATRVVMLFDVDASGHIRAVHTVLAPGKLSHVRWPAA
jgi:RNA polymerase sigma-70 factor (ECF subfamily)